MIQSTGLINFYASKFSLYTVFVPALYPFFSSIQIFCNDTGFDVVIGSNRVHCNETGQLVSQSGSLLTTPTLCHLIIDRFMYEPLLMISDIRERLYVRLTTQCAWQVTTPPQVSFNCCSINHHSYINVDTIVKMALSVMRRTPRSVTVLLANMERFAFSSKSIICYTLLYLTL